MSTEKKTNKKIQELIKKLQSPEPKTQIKAIQSIKIHGDKSTIEPLISLHTSTKNNAVRSEIEDLLNTLKDSSVRSSVIACLTNQQYKPSHQAILSSIWNSNLDYSAYLNEIVEAAISGDFMDAMECLTIFENLESDLTEDKVMPPLLTLNQYLNAQEDKTSPKNNLLTEVALFLNQVNQSL